MLLLLFFYSAFPWHWNQPDILCSGNYNDYWSLPYGNMTWTICPNIDLNKAEFAAAARDYQLPYIFMKNRTVTIPMTGENVSQIQLAPWSKSLPGNPELPDEVALNHWVRGWKIPHISGYNHHGLYHYMACFLTFTNGVHGITDVKMDWGSCIAYIELGKGDFFFHELRKPIPKRLTLLPHPAMEMHAPLQPPEPFPEPPDNWNGLLMHCLQVFVFCIVMYFILICGYILKMCYLPADKMADEENLKNKSLANKKIPDFLPN